MHPYWNHVGTVLALIYILLTAVVILVIAAVALREVTTQQYNKFKTRRNDKRIFKVAERGRRDFR